MNRIKYTVPPMLLLLFVCFMATSSIGQTKYVNLIRAISNDDDVKKVYDSLHIPLMVFRNAVYSVNADCINESFGQPEGGGSSSSKGGRKSGGGSDVPEVSSGGGRKSGGGSDVPEASSKGGRKSGGGSDVPDASSGGGRKSGGGSDVPEASSKGGRKSGGGSYGFYCEMESNGKLILYIEGMQKHEEIRIFYNNTFIDSKYYKIKQL